MTVPAVDWGRTREALDAAVGRLMELVAAVRDPAAPGTGEWTASQTAAHLTHSFAVNRSLVLGSGIEVPPELTAPGNLVAAISRFNDANLEADPERDLRVLGPRIGETARDFLAKTLEAAGDEPVSWLGGAKVTISGVACHMIGETLLHGSDIARGSGLPWTIPGPSASLVFEGFTLAMIDTLDPRMFVDQRKAAGLRCRVDMRLRKGPRILFVLEDGALRLENPVGARVDCHISIDPATNFLLAWGRVDPIRAMMQGRLIVWGRRPWKAAKLIEALGTP